MISSINEMTVEQYLGFKEQGLLDWEVLEEIGYSGNSHMILNKWKRERGLDFKNRKTLTKKKLEDFTVEEFLTMKKQGLRNIDIAAIKNVNGRTLSFWIKEQQEAGALPEDYTRAPRIKVRH